MDAPGIFDSVNLPDNKNKISFVFSSNKVDILRNESATSGYRTILFSRPFTLLNLLAMSSDH